MPEAYDLHEARLLQTRNISSAAGALSVAAGPVPAGKVWTIRAGSYNPSVTETKVVWWFIYNALSMSFPISVPVSIALGTTIGFPLLTDGMEIKLYPGEYIEAGRESATAGSTMSIAISFIESDLPYYSYEEPQRKVVKSQVAHGSVYRSSGGISSAGGGGGTGVDGGGGGHGHGGQPI